MNVPGVYLVHVLALAALRRRRPRLPDCSISRSWARRWPGWPWPSAPTARGPGVRPGPSSGSTTSRPDPGTPASVTSSSASPSRGRPPRRVVDLGRPRPLGLGFAGLGLGAAAASSPTRSSWDRRWPPSPGATRRAPASRRWPLLGIGTALPAGGLLALAGARPGAWRPSWTSWAATCCPSTPPGARVDSRGPAGPPPCARPGRAGRARAGRAGRIRGAVAGRPGGRARGRARRRRGLRRAPLRPAGEGVGVPPLPVRPLRGGRRRRRAGRGPGVAVADRDRGPGGRPGRDRGRSRRTKGARSLAPEWIAAKQARVRAVVERAGPRSSRRGGPCRCSTRPTAASTPSTSWAPASRRASSTTSTSTTTSATPTSSGCAGSSSQGLRARPPAAVVLFEHGLAERGLRAPGGLPGAGRRGSTTAIGWPASGDGYRIYAARGDR